MSVSEQMVLDALKKVNYPGLKRDIVSFGMVKKVIVKDNAVDLEINFTTNDPKIKDALYDQIREAVLTLDGIDHVNPTLKRLSTRILKIKIRLMTRPGFRESKVFWRLPQAKAGSAKARYRPTLPSAWPKKATGLACSTPMCMAPRCT
jgi:metal-sulfur cluster biosynthetic enzyme